MQNQWQILSQLFNAITTQKSGSIEHAIQQYGDPRVVLGNGAEFVAVDTAGNMYGGDPIPRNLQKYIRVR